MRRDIYSTLILFIFTKLYEKQVNYQRCTIINEVHEANMDLSSSVSSFSKRLGREERA